jgi:hypothetical protein
MFMCVVFVLLAGQSRTLYIALCSASWEINSCTLYVQEVGRLLQLVLLFF